MSSEQQVLDQLTSALWGAAYKSSITDVIKRLALKNGLADVTCGEQFFKVFGDPCPGEWKMLVLTIAGRRHEFDEEQFWNKWRPLDLRPFFTEAAPHQSSSRSRSPPTTGLFGLLRHS